MNWRNKGLEFAVEEFERHGIVNIRRWEKTLDYLQEAGMFRFRKGEPGEGAVEGTIKIGEQSFPVKVVRDKDGNLDFHSEQDIPDGNADIVVEGNKYKAKMAQGRFITK